MEQYRSAARRGSFRASKGTKYTKLVILLTTLVLLLLMHLGWIRLDTTGFDFEYAYTTWSLITAILDGYLPIGLLLLYIIRLLIRLFALVMCFSTLSLLVRRDARYKKRFVLTCLAMVAMFLFTLFLVIGWNSLTLSKVIAEKIGQKPFSMSGVCIVTCILSVLVPFVAMPVLRRLK